MNNEQLPPHFFQHFFPEELYAIPEKQTEAKAPAKAAAASLAPALQAAAPVAVDVPAPAPVVPAVTKKAAVVVNMMDQDFANLHEHQMLMRLLAAIKLAPEDVAFVNLTGQVTDLDKLEPGVAFDNLLLFLAPNHPLALHHKLVPFQVMRVQNKYVLLGAELRALSANRELKEKLWTGLQAMFL